MNAKLLMKTLALDFSTLHRSVALFDGPNLIREATEKAERGGSPFPLISRVLADTKPAQINRIAVGLGPGSYVGIRSSLAIAQGWHLARGVHAAGVSSIDAIAYQAWKSGMRGAVEVAIDAQRNEIYSCGYDLDESGEFKVTQPLAILQKPRGCGILIGVDTAASFYPTASAVGFLAFNRPFGLPQTLQAIYLREPSFVKAPAPLLSL